MTLPEEDELVAAELALGLLDPADRAAAEARLAEDAAFRAAHARWQDYAVAMIAGNEQPPRPSIWGELQARLPGNDTAPAARPANVRWWQASTALASIAAVLLGAIALRPAPPPVIVAAAPPPPAPVPAQLVAVLVGDKDNGAIAVSYDPASDRLILTPTRLAIGRRDAELWVIGDSAKPRSLGVIPAGEVARRNPSLELARELKAGATLAVSAEPIGGSPTGQPTGPVLYVGKISAT